MLKRVLVSTTVVLLLLSGARSSAVLQPQQQQAAPVQPQPGTPTGEVIKAEFAQSKIYPGTWREYWVYVPKQLDRSKPAPVMVFQDGLQYNAPVVFDDLIHKKAIPPLVGVFVMHGRVKAPSRRRARSDEPQLRVRRGQRRLRPLSDRRAAAARREDARPDALDPIPTIAPSPATAAAPSPRLPRPGSAPMRSGASSARSAPTSACAAATSTRCSFARPSRSRCASSSQDGQNDLNNYTGNWWIANQDMLSALQYAGYDVRHEWGDGEHNSRHATAIFPGGGALAVARLAGADQSQPGGRVAPGRLSGADPRRGVAARQPGASLHRRPGRQCDGGDLLHRSCQQSDPQGRARRQGSASSPRTRPARTA